MSRGAPAIVSDRILFRVDVPADQWLGLVTHEVAHVFGFDILPGSATPAWISEGLAEYERNAWDPNDLVLLREAVRTNAVPRVTTLRSDGAEKRFVEALGHAAFDFIESRWGKAGMRQFLLALRRSAEWWRRSRTKPRSACRLASSIARSRATCGRGCATAAPSPSRARSTRCQRYRSKA